MLYSSDHIVIFYGSNSWAYTRLGRIQGMDKKGLKSLLDGPGVTLTLTSSNAGEQRKYPIEDVMLNTKFRMPVIGLGTWTYTDDQAEICVYHSLKAGIRLIDCARMYACEVGVGRGIRKAISEGFVTREEIFVTSKIAPCSFDRAEKELNNSLRELGLDYIDLMMVHQSGRNEKALYRALEKGVADKKIRSIGISNYYTKQALDEVLSYAKIIPAVVQNENHLFYQNTELQSYALQYGIVIQAWYPFGGRGHTKQHMSNNLISALSRKYSKSPAQIILRWQVQAGYVVVPGSTSLSHITENYNIFDFELTEEEMKQISGLNKKKRYESW